MKRTSLVCFTLFGVFGIAGAQWTTTTTLNSATVVTGGSVGIGTNAPSEKLNVYGNGPTRILIGNPNTSSGGFTSLSMGISADTDGYSLIQSIKSSGSSFGDLILNRYGGNVGIGTLNPQAKLDVFTTATLGASPGNYILLNRFYSVSGDGGNHFIKGSWLYRDAAGNNWMTARLHDGISIDGSYGTPGTSTRTWWERDPFDNIQSWGTGDQAYMTLKNENLGIGTIVPDERLTVKGTIHTHEVRVDSEPEVVPDYVFEEGYRLTPLTEVETYVKANKHLPEVPSAEEIGENGLHLKEMNLILLKKVEELTLHLIEANKRIDRQQAEITDLKEIIKN